MCQNSWGGSFGNDGLFYVSYADATIAGQAIAYTRIESTDNYDRIYQTDPCGWQGSLGYGKEMCWFANRYEAEEAELWRRSVFMRQERTQLMRFISSRTDQMAGRNERCCRPGVFRRQAIIQWIWKRQ